MVAVVAADADQSSCAHTARRFIAIRFHSGIKVSIFFMTFSLVSTQCSMFALLFSLAYQWAIGRLSRRTCSDVWTYFVYFFFLRWDTYKFNRLLNLGVLVSLSHRLMRMMTKMEGREKCASWRKRHNVGILTSIYWQSVFCFCSFFSPQLVRWFCRFWFIVHRHHCQQSAWCSFTQCMYEVDDERLMHADSCGISRLSFGKLGDKCK